MKYVFCIFSFLFIITFSLCAALAIERVDAADPSSDFSNTFNISIEDEGYGYLITISYASKPEEKISSIYSDGQVLEQYSDGVVDYCQLILLDEKDGRIVSAPLKFTRSRDNLTTAKFIVNKSNLKSLEVHIFLPVMKSGRPFCYQVYFDNVE